MGKYIIRGLAGLLLAALALYLGDWAVWKIRGGPTATASVSRFQVAALKGNKEEFYFDGTGDVVCSRSIFPQAGGGACWWVRRNPVVFYR